MPFHQDLRIIVWSTLGVVLGTALLAPVYFMLITPIGPPVTLFEVYRWQFAAWSAWIFLAPACIHYGDWIVFRNRARRWRPWMLHVAGAVGAVTIHASWMVAVSIWLSPYVTLVKPLGALTFVLRFSAPIDVAIYAALVAGTARAAVSMLNLRATSEGFLRTTSSGSPQLLGQDDPVLEATPGPVLVYDPDSLNLLAVNEAAVAQYGWTAEEFQRMSLLDIRTPDSAPRVRANIEKNRDLPVWRAHSQHQRRDGTTFEVELTNHAVIFDGRWARMVLVNDVTAVERAQRALEESERKFRAIFEDAVTGIFRSTPDGRLTMLNAAGARILGYADAGSAMHNVKDLASDHYLDPAERAEFVDAIREMGQVVDRLIRLRRRDGAVIWVSENARAVNGADGRLDYIEGTFTDVSGAIAAQEALRKSERSTAELRAQLADAQLRALKLQLKPHFLFNILNTVAMMIRDGDSAGAQRVVTMLGDMFRYFLEFEGEDTLPLKQELAFLDLYLNLEQFRFADRMTVTRRVDDAAYGVHVPALILQPVVENAIKHGVARTTGCCRIELSARRANGVLTIEVVNDVGSGGGVVGSSRRGIGVTNTRARLNEMYGDRANFELALGKHQARAVLTIPVEERTR